MNRLRFIFECNSFSLILKRYFVLVVRGSNVDIFFFFNVVGCKLYFEIKNFWLVICIIEYILYVFCGGCYKILKWIGGFFYIIEI